METRDELFLRCGQSMQRKGLPREEIDKVFLVPMHRKKVKIGYDKPDIITRYEKRSTIK
jgi:hypothetical protein